MSHLTTKNSNRKWNFRSKEKLDIVTNVYWETMSNDNKWPFKALFELSVQVVARTALTYNAISQDFITKSYL